MSRKAITEVIIGILAIVSIVLVAVESLAPVTFDELIGIYIADFVICIVFAADFIQRLRSSESKSQFMKRNGFEILAMVPAIGLYALGTIPALSILFRSLRLVRVLRVILILARVERVFLRLDSFIQRSHLIALSCITISIVFIGAIAVLIFDSGTGSAQIHNFSDAIWWSIATISTVGYGDIVPHSAAGRITGMVLMIVGIGVMAALISEVSATLVESRIKRHVEKHDFKTALISEIKSRLDNIDSLSDGELSLLLQTIQALKLKVGEKS